MKLRKIDINKLPGIPNGFTVDNIGKKVNLIHGSNASGKTSICRLIKNALWPMEKDYLQTNASLYLIDAQKNVFIAEVKNTVRWLKNNEEIILPDLPDKIMANCFSISLSELLDIENQTEKHLAQKIYVQLTGGYDIKAIQKLLQITNRAGSNEVKCFEQLKLSLAQIQKEYDDLVKAEDSLSELKKKLEKAKVACTNLSLISKAEEAFALKESLKKNEDSIATFPANMELIFGNEIDKLQEIDDDIRKKENELLICQSQIYELNEKIRALPLQKDPVSLPELSTYLFKAEKLNHLWLTLCATEKEYKIIQKILSELNFHIKDFFNNETTSKLISQDMLEELDNLIRQSRELLENKNNITSRLDLLDLELEQLHLDSNNDYNSKIFSIISLLQKWLSIPEIKTSITFLIFSCALIILGGIFSFFYPWFLFLSGFGSAAIVYNLVQKIYVGKRKKEIEKEYLNLTGSQLLATKTEIVVLLEKLMQRKIFFESNRNKASKLEGGKIEYNSRLSKLEKDISTIQNKIDAIKVSLNLPSQVNGLAFVDLVNSLKIYQNEYLRFINLSEKYELEKAEYENLKSEIISFMIKIKLTVKNDLPDEVIVGLNGLKDLILHYDNLNNIKKDKEFIIRQIKSHINALMERKEKLFKEAGIHEFKNAETILKNCIKNVPDYSRLVQEKTELENKLNEINSIDNGFLKSLLSESIDRIDKEREQQQNIAQSYDNILRQMQEIETKVELTEREKKIVQKKQELEQSKLEVEKVVDDIASKLATKFFLEKVEKEFEEKNQPKIMQYAAEYFKIFTGNNYSLEFDMENSRPSFIAFDIVQQQRIPLINLSDATRIQLYLAVRLAFIKSIEKKYKLPIFLDESLSTTDPVRFNQIAQTLFSIANEDDRQVFYMTSDPNEIPKWKSVSNSFSKDALIVFELDKIRNL